MKFSKFFASILFTVILARYAFTQENTAHYTISNEKLSYTLVAKNGQIDREIFRSKSSGSDDKTFELHTDGGFSFEVMWTYWRAPGKLHNAENPVVFTQKNFRIDSISTQNLNGDRLMTVYLKPVKHHLKVRIEYQLPGHAFYIRKKIIIQDPKANKHFLQKISPVNFSVSSSQIDKWIKNGGFGQPVGFIAGNHGVFVGLEYPAADQFIYNQHDAYQIECTQEIGQKIDNKGIASHWAVIGITPDERLRWWFYQYMDDIRFKIDKPYTLYNSWYDLRSPAFKNIPPENVMNEENIMRIIDLIKKNMTDKYGIHLDAFVLDDGWDVYESDWQIRKETFPRGMKPISDKLKEMNTGLGIWFGPTGGYSFRNKRIKWMMEHGYEVVGDTSKRHDAMLCLAGKNYSRLFRKRVTDFVKDHGVSFFKWDGIQFSCSEPDHGHPVGIYSRRAVMQSVVDKCDAVRAINPDVYLNITSGTWLSPWWLLYANQIWMQGYDYGFANTPSISKRDAAMTYRDYVLWDDFKHHDNWFPIANLMTHGIIKGNLQKLGGEKEPLDKFTNNALLYFARGVSMYELYISPDILTDDEWKSISQSLKWAKDRFDILKNTFYEGGNPAEQEAYGYVHFKGNKGIIAARNPYIDSQILKIKLDLALGLNHDAKDLVVEQVYPYHYIFNRTFQTGDSISLTLNGYETAVYEIYPKNTARWLLPAGTKFRYRKLDTKNMEYTFYDYDSITILNPEMIRKTYYKGSKVKDISENLYYGVQYPVSGIEIASRLKDSIIEFSIRMPAETENIQLAILFKNQKQDKIPAIQLEKNDHILFENEYKQKSKWLWKTYRLNSNKVEGKFIINADEEINDLKEKIKLFIIYDEERNDAKTFRFKFKKSIPDRIMPPEIYQSKYVRKIKEIPLQG